MLGFVRSFFFRWFFDYVAILFYGAHCVALRYGSLAPFCNGFHTPGCHATGGGEFSRSSALLVRLVMFDGAVVKQSLD